jgi:hypothetical protein
MSAVQKLPLMSFRVVPDLAGLSAAAALRVATQGQTSVHGFEKTAMTARGAAILVGVNGLKALQAIDPVLLDGLLGKATKLEGSGECYFCMLSCVMFDQVFDQI